jgi:uncharacterized integral membrane protein
MSAARAARQGAGAAARLEHPAVAKVSLSHAPGDPVVEVAAKHQGQPKQSIIIVIIIIIIIIIISSSSSDSSRTHTVQVKFAFGKCSHPTRP